MIDLFSYISGVLVSGACIGFSSFFISYIKSKLPSGGAIDSADRIQVDYLKNELKRLKRCRNMHQVINIANDALKNVE